MCYVQVASDGSMPLEDRRSNSFGYHIGNLNNFLDLSALSSASAGPDLFEYVGASGAGLEQALA